MTLPPPTVAFVTMASQDLEKTEDLPGRVVAYRVAEIRPQVSGIVQKRLFEQGTDVQAGDPLFQIDAAPFKAEVESAAATLRRAEAVLAQAETKAARMKPLVASEAVSQQTYDDAVSQRAQALAEVAQARAALARRKLDLNYTTVNSPIGGRIDEAQVTEGALVNAGDTAPMAKVQQIDRVYIDVRQPARMLDSWKSAPPMDRTSPVAPTINILREDGKPYDEKARVLFSSIGVDEGTGDVLMRVLVGNKDHRLLPGMFVRTRLVRATYPQALAVPQQAVVRSGGEPSVWVLNDKNEVHRTKVELGDLINRSYHVVSGLQAGQKVVIEGVDRLSDGTKVTLRSSDPTDANGATASSPQAQSDSAPVANKDG